MGNIKKKFSTVENLTDKNALHLDETSGNIIVEGHTGTWYVIDSDCIDGKKVFLLESEVYGDEAACIIVDEKAELLLDEVWNGFDDYRYHLDCYDMDEIETEE